MVEFPMLLDRLLAVLTLFVSLKFCWSLNDEGLALLKFRENVVSDPFGGLADWSDDVGVANPCAWNGIVCSSGFVVSLNLKDLCLGGSIAPDIGSLIHLKSIVLRNNSFYGTIPDSIAKLKELEVLDLGYNNLSGPFPTDLGNNLSLAILLLDHNGLAGSFSPEVVELQMLSEAQVDENQLFPWNTAESKDETARKLAELLPARPRNIQVPPFKQPGSPPPLPSLPRSPPPSLPATPKQFLLPPPAPEDSRNGPSVSAKDSNSRNLALLLSLTIGTPVLFLLIVIGYVLYRSSKIAVKPWATGLSGQLQKAFVTGVPKLNRPELVTACEDFSNVIGGTTSSGTLYKGTLSSGVEIAALSFSAASAKDWSKNKEKQFRNKIETLSKVNHKNFVNLLGFCEEEEPFTRMMVFEYAPNGTLFEHLHIREAEHLDWSMRMRILMGIAYCLQHTHQLSPPITHQKLNSSGVYLTEDYAAKVSDFGFWDKAAANEMDQNLESNIYNFGVLIFEMVTGQLPCAVDRSSGEDWASDYLGGQPLKNMVDPTLESFEENQLENIEEVMRACVQPEPRKRPEMRDITARLREVTGIAPDAAVPRLSPLWWAELEILSTEAN